MEPASNTPLSLLRCPHCKYQLRGLRETRCPECGREFDHDLLISIGHKRRRLRQRRIVASLVLLPAMYAPYSWLLFIDYPWNAYRWSWIKMWTALPLLLPASSVRKWIPGDADGTASLIVLSLLVAMLCAGLIFLSARRWRVLIIIAAIVLLLSTANAFILHGLFLM